jgi:YVTN family beta-propeller protein
MPSALCYDPVGAKVYCANLSDDSVSVIAGERPQVVAEVEVGGGPAVLCWNSEDNKVYCANLADGTVSVIDAGADTVVAELAVGSEPVALSYDSLNNYVYCACRGSNHVAVIDGRRDSVVATVQVGAEPVALVWNPIELRTYVANYSSSTVSVIRDSLHVGVAEAGANAMRLVTPTVVRGMLMLGGKARAVLLDIAGRRVADLLPGRNDIRHLAPGVYLIREQSAFSSQQSGVECGARSAAHARKVIVQR